jgi:hypothetical protein
MDIQKALEVWSHKFKKRHKFYEMKTISEEIITDQLLLNI